MAKAKARAGVGGELSGRVGGLVYVQGPNETPATTPRARIMAEERVALAAGVWQGLSPEAMGRWRLYAESLAATEPALARSPARAWNAFYALAGRVMQIELGAAVPTEPPAGFFAGDAVRVTASGSGGIGGSTGPGGTPSPTVFHAGARSHPSGRSSLQGEPSPGVLFVADRANGAGIVTELLTQPLANAGRTPVGGKYRSRSFVAFGPAPEAAVPLPAGWHACAVRFVERATGRATALFPCGVVRVA